MFKSCAQLSKSRQKLDLILGNKVVQKLKFSKNVNNKKCAPIIIFFWLLVLGIKEGLVECATVCVKSVVILIHMLQYISSKALAILVGVGSLPAY